MLEHETNSKTRNIGIVLSILLSQFRAGDAFTERIRVNAIIPKVV